MFKSRFLGVLLAILAMAPMSGATAQQSFSYPAEVVAAAQRQEATREQEWRDCFAQSLAANADPNGADWHFVARLFNACAAAERRYVRAALTAAQRRFPEPRTDQYGRIVAWDQLSNLVRSTRRATWLRIRGEMENSAAAALALQPRCEWRYTNYATRGANWCSVDDSEMGMLLFDQEQLGR